jgi:hypothetical protein
MSLGKPPSSLNLARSRSTLVRFVSSKPEGAWTGPKIRQAAKSPSPRTARTPTLRLAACNES